MAVGQIGNVKVALVNISSATTTTIVAAVANKSIVVLGYQLNLSGTTTPTFLFQDGASTNLMGSFGTGAAAGVATGFSVMGQRDMPLFSGANGQSLRIVSAGTAPNIQGNVQYRESDD